MSYQKPLVTIELDEYNKMLKYIKLLDESIGENCEPYKKALQKIINTFSSYNYIQSEIQYSVNMTENIRRIIMSAVLENKIKVDINGEIVGLEK